MPDEIEVVVAEIEAAASTEVSELEAIDQPHHVIAVKAFELWEAMITANGVDYGPDFYWYEARFQLNLGPAPLPPPVE